jgi:hypothetical protein
MSPSLFRALRIWIRPTPGRGWHFVYSWLAAGLLASSAGAVEAQTLRFTHASAVAADTEYFPELPQVRTVDLPDDWAMSRPDQSGPVWYRMNFDARRCAPAASCWRCTSSARAARWPCG